MARRRMNFAPHQILIYHITDLENLPGVLRDGVLQCDATMAKRTPMVIGYSHIKERRLREIKVPCCAHRFVGEFVPFYFCARSPMLFTINKGRTGRPEGCQSTVLHLVSTLAIGIELGRPWAISDGNAGAFHTSFFTDIGALNGLDWTAIRATDWRGKTHEKQAEFLVADFFPWNGVQQIGCYNSEVASSVKSLIISQEHKPDVHVKPEWYYGI